MDLRQSVELQILVSAILGALFSGIVSLIIVMLVSKHSKPRLRLEIEPPARPAFVGTSPEDAPAGPFTALRLRVVNEPLGPLTRWWLISTYINRF